ncbi:xylan 1,4-beta-xylosidase [Bryocella elongata]|uniref:Xylan 1,4-beta-xylosidase n=1 Tax=Bryocella elongata TaxID=863522 RepID=A0A1H5YFW6_9BACT|nr:glycosyl hydrolase family 39 [Bryocella elongata]SEG22961.1 xylan 1,4-beta-xylosidase [Bryocella elongata]
MNRFSFASLAILAAFAAPLVAQQTLTIDANAPAKPFPHFWEQTFGSGRAVLSLREEYRDDLRAVHAATGFQSVRFHGIFNDEVGLYDPDRRVINFAQTLGQEGEAVGKNSIYNFSYVDQIYDGLLANGVRPYVEMSFMPAKMTSDPKQIQAFWYRPNVAPPADYAKWDAMIQAFAKHLVERYGIDEVSTWKFEVWNEPNLDFWMGAPKQPTYFELYDHTARALKSVSPRIQVGGPATAQAAWVTPFLEHIKESGAPVDFVSTHVYGNDSAKDVFGTTENIPRDQMVYRSVKKVHDEIAASAFPKLPLIFSEYNASYANEPNITDSPYMAAWLPNTIRQCDGLISNMAMWDFSDVFEEQGVVRTPFYGGFGLMAEREIPKAIFNTYVALHKLGDQRIAVDSDSALATKTSNGLAIALWNYAPPTGEGANYTPENGPDAKPAGPAKEFTLKLEHAGTNVEVLRVDPDHGNVLKAYDAMGRPAWPSREQIAELRKAGAMAPAEHMKLKNGELHLSVPAHGMAVVLVSK